MKKKEYNKHRVRLQNKTKENEKSKEWNNHRGTEDTEIEKNKRG